MRSFIIAAKITLCLVFVFLHSVSYADVLGRSASGLPLFKLTLEESAKIAVDNSHNIAAQRETSLAAKETAASADTQRFPHITFQGQTKMTSKVGEVVVPGVGSFQAGDHYNWSVGPVLDWVAWDAGQIAKNAKSLKFAAEAEKFNTETVDRNVVLSSRTAYFAVQIASEQLSLVADALNLARSQYAVVSERANVGSASRLDKVVAHQEVMDREKDYEDAGRELSIQVRNLFAVLGQDQINEPSFPADINLAKSLKAPPIVPDMLIVLDSISQSLAAMRPRGEGVAEIGEHPSFKSAVEETNAARLAFESARSAHWPKVSVEGKVSYDYPNFAQKSRVQQNTLLLGLNLPVIDWGMISKQARSQKHKELAAIEQMRQTEIDLSKDIVQTRDQIAILEKARATCASKVKDAVETAKLVFEEYIAGHIIFLEVQRANDRALRAKVDAARNDTQLLGSLAKMESLITKPEKENE